MEHEVNTKNNKYEGKKKKKSGIQNSWNIHRGESTISDVLLL
jgi:hypothetical protein